jgi:chorismate-pyruvate lyase
VVPVLAIAARRSWGSEATTKPTPGIATAGLARQQAAHILERALSRTGDTVTAVLETLTGEAVDADAIGHAAIVASAPNCLGVGAGHALVSRRAILRGRTSRRAYVYAETVLVPDRLPADVPHLLETTNDPIGRLLAARGVGMTRTVLGAPHRTPSVAGLGPGNAADAAILARRSRVDSCGAVVMLIDEWFLPGLGDVVMGVG